MVAKGPLHSDCSKGKYTCGSMRCNRRILFIANVKVQIAILVIVVVHHLGAFSREILFWRRYPLHYSMSTFHLTCLIEREFHSPDPRTLCLLFPHSPKTFQGNDKVILGLKIVKFATAFRFAEVREKPKVETLEAKLKMTNLGETSQNFLIGRKNMSLSYSLTQICQLFWLIGLPWSRQQYNKRNWSLDHYLSNAALV
jgi:hypothetical protein